jgi:hypothetical protein
MLGDMMEVSGGTGTLTISNAHHFMENGDWAAIELVFRGQRAGARLAQSSVDLLRVENAGSIRRSIRSSSCSRHGRREQRRLFTQLNAGA